MQVTGTSPVFIIGSMRSGTTLLRYLLDTHPMLACPPESKFLTGLDRMLDDPQTARALHHLGFSRQAVLKHFRNLAEAFLQGYADRAGKRRWVDKTPNYFRILPFLEDLFERTALHVFAVRHPLDTIASLEKFVLPAASHEDPDVARMAAFYGKGRFGWARYWLEVYERLDYFLTAIPERCHLVKYEDLVSNPEGEVRAILEFLGEDPALCELEKAFTMAHTRGFQDEKILQTREVHTNSVGRWREWPLSEARAVWDVVGGLALKYGYSSP